jgi:hypothetical protein
MQEMARNQAMMQRSQQAQREGSEAEINGQQRPGSPSSNDNAPSPSKRPRIGGDFNGQPAMGPNGMPQRPGQPGNAAQQAQSLLIQNGINPNQLTAQQFTSFQNQNPGVQQKSIQVYAQNLADHHQRNSTLQGQKMPPNGPQNGSPMIPQNSEGGPGTNVMGEMFSGGQQGAAMQAMRGQAGPSTQGGNHALQDYQMQLMLLEQQNKKRLLMARQEQDSINRPMAADQASGQFAQGMSPQGARPGPSPNPSQQNRGTPTMKQQTGVPGSPAPDGMPQRGSPAAMGFGGGDMAQNPQFYHNMTQNGKGVMPNGMRPPPSSHPSFPNGQMSQQEMANMAAAQRAGQQPGQAWQQGQGQQINMQQPPPGNMRGVAQQQAMPPPPTAGANGTAARTPASPQQPPGPPTPQQANKANPAKGGKKETKGGKVVFLAMTYTFIGILTLLSAPKRRTLLLAQPMLLQPRAQRPNLRLPQIHRHLLRPITRIHSTLDQIKVVQV